MTYLLGGKEQDKMRRQHAVAFSSVETLTETQQGLVVMSACGRTRKRYSNLGKFWSGVVASMVADSFK
ncbi:hypothetical protein V2H77_15270 [Photorhabdus sp. P32]|uniref:hypothetical protein n=1 Tax=Photorhabdus sp. P32 TaxID=3117549 RepID=UPI00311B1190